MEFDLHYYGRDEQPMEHRSDSGFLDQRIGIPLEGLKLPSGLLQNQTFLPSVNPLSA